MAAPMKSAQKIGTQVCSQIRRLRRVDSFKFPHRSTVSKSYFTEQRIGKTNPVFSIKVRTLSSLQKDRKCWKCGSPTDGEIELFFCNCGVVQSVPSDLTYFRVMNCEEKFDIDVNRLSNFYKDLQRNLHPDKYSQKSKEELALAEQQSSFVNKAYTTLLKPLSRGQYLLELRGDPIEESNTAVDPTFLMEIMEFNEDIAETSSSQGNMDALMQLDNINNARMEKCIGDVSKAFAENDVPKAKQCLIYLKYFSNIDDKIKDIYRKHMDH